MTHHVIHPLVRDYIGRGLHHVDVREASHSPRLYFADCNNCDWKSQIGTADEADKTLMKHRDDTVATAQAGRRF